MKIAVVGSINMDMTIIADRIPNKGETLMGESIQYVPGGKGANQAVAIAKLGGNVEMFGCVGNDGAGETLLQNFKKQGVIIDHIAKREDVATGVASITVAENDNAIVVVPAANGTVDIPYVQSIESELKACDMVVLQHEIPLKTVDYLVDFCSKNGIATVLNPAPAAPVSEETIAKVTWLTPNEHEAKLIFGNEKTTEEILKAYPEKVLITQGVKGVSVCLKSGEICTVPARKSQVVDTTGAGDTLNGAFALRIAMGDSVTDALRYANIAAGLSVEKFGAQGGMPTAAEVEALL